MLYMLQLLVLLLLQPKGCCEMHYVVGAEESQEPALPDRVEGCRHWEEAPTMVHDIFVTVPCPILPAMALPYSNCGSGYNWGIMSCRQRRRVGVLGQCNTKQESIHHRAGLAAHNLWNTMHRRQVCIFLCLQKRHFWASTHHTC